MANDLNQCSFIGRLGADPETRYVPSGEAVCNFRIAVGWKSKDKEGAEWVPCSSFGKLAEICGQYLTKGSQVFVQGRFRTRKWADKDGNDRYTTEIVVDQMQMLGGKPSSSDSAPQQRQEPQRQQQKPAQQPSGGSGGGFGNFDDDIPFASVGFGASWRVI